MKNWYELKYFDYVKEKAECYEKLAQCKKIVCQEQCSNTEFGHCAKTFATTDNLDFLSCVINCAK